MSSTELSGLSREELLDRLEVLLVELDENQRRLSNLTGVIATKTEGMKEAAALLKPHGA